MLSKNVFLIFLSGTFFHLVSPRLVIICKYAFVRYWFFQVCIYVGLHRFHEGKVSLLALQNSWLAPSSWSHMIVFAFIIRSDSRLSIFLMTRAYFLSPARFIISPGSSLLS